MQRANHLSCLRLVMYQAGALSGLIGIASGFAVPGLAQEKPRPSERPTARTLLAGLQDAFAEVAEEASPAVVTILSSKAARADEEGGIPGMRSSPWGRNLRRSTGTGTGVIIRRDGWVLTNDHVVNGADKVKVRLNNGREYAGRVVRDFRSDLALVKIDSATSFPVARLGDSDKVKVGHWAIAIGSPYRYDGTFSVGVVSSLNRTQKIRDGNSPDGMRLYPNMIQTDAAINPGNSGGPLLNLDGEVIAINTAIESEGGGSIGIGFAIPINTVKFVVNQLIEHGRVRYGFLGVRPVTVTPDKAEALKVERGALIEAEPEADTPAGKAGLRAGDVVTAIGSRAVRNEIDFRTIIGQTTPGTIVDLTVVREGRPQVLKATLSEIEEREPEKPRVARKPSLGLEVQSLTEAMARRLGVSHKVPGVVIKSIDPAGAAAEDDTLAEGMLVLKVNNTETPTVEAFKTATSALKEGDKVKLYVQDREGKRFVFLTID
jgi:serine protease Do